MRAILEKSFCMSLLLVWTAVAIGCDEQKPPEGKMVCQNDSHCPSDWFCNLSDHFCYSAGNDQDAGD